MRKFLTVLMLAALVAACGGDGVDTTTTGEVGETTITTETEPSTTIVEDTTTTDDDDGPSVGIGDLPPECVDAFVGFLRLMEPIVEDTDWANVSMDDLEAMGTELEPLADAYATEIEDLDCDDVELEGDDEESFQYMIDLARDEAPGTVGYLEWIRDIAIGEGPEATGDCETDIAALESIIGGGGTMAELPLAQVSSVGALMTSITTACSPERSQEFFNQADVQEFIGGAG